MDDFTITVYVCQEKVDDNNLKGLLGDDNKLRRWSSLIIHLACMCHQSSPYLIKPACH